MPRFSRHQRSSEAQPTWIEGALVLADLTDESERGAVGVAVRVALRGRPADRPLARLVHEGLSIHEMRDSIWEELRHVTKCDSDPIRVHAAWIAIGGLTVLAHNVAVAVKPDRRFPFDALDWSQRRIRWREARPRYHQALIESRSVEGLNWDLAAFLRDVSIIAGEDGVSGEVPDLRERITHLLGAVGGCTGQDLQDRSGPVAESRGSTAQEPLQPTSGTEEAECLKKLQLAQGEFVPNLGREAVSRLRKKGWRIESATEARKARKQDVKSDAKGHRLLG